jgi:hypothetical protein
MEVVICIVCIEIMNNRLTLNEAKIALEELLIEDSKDDEHYKDLYLGIIGDLLEDKSNENIKN